MIFLLSFTLFFSVAVAYGQGPGTLPPSGLLQDAAPWPEQLEGIRPDAFLFQDESNTPVVMPRMSFEEIDRLRKLDRGGRSGDQIATLERLSITGTMGQTRAQWKAELAVRLDAAAVREAVGRSVVVDIGFAGAHLLQAADVRFVPGSNTDLDDASVEGAASDKAASDSAASDSAASDSVDHGSASKEELVSGAYVRLTPRQTLGQIGKGPFNNTTAMPNSTGPMSGVPPDLSPLPTTFPTVLRQALGVEGDALTRRGGGYQLVLPIESLLQKFLSPRTSMVVKVHLEYSARVWLTPPSQSWLPLSLPSVPTLIQMELDDSNDDEDEETALLDVIGSGREVARRLEGSNRYAVESDGGLIALRASGAVESAGDTGDLLEVESETQLQWESPTEPPTMDVRLVTKNLRGPLLGCEIRLPAAAVLVSPPEIISATNESRDTSVVASGTPDSAWWEVAIVRADNAQSSSRSEDSQANTPASTKEPDQEDATRIMVRWVGTDQMQAPSSVRLRLQIRQFPPDATATDPWVLRIPQVADAIGHRGQVTIRTATDHRLRWRPRMGIDAVVAEQINTVNGDLVYPFRFTQTRFELPIWLASKQQQIRLTADAKLSVTRRAARVQIDVRSGGVGIDPKDLRLELGAWQLIGIKTEIADTELEITTNDGNVEWQVDTSDGKWPASYQITAELLATANEFQSITLPRLTSTDAASVLRDVRLSLADDHREAWLVDLAGSPALQRIAGQSDSGFRFLIPESPWTLNGSFATRPLELQWGGEVSATQAADHWVIRSEWTITSELDLEGRLKFTLPTLGNHYLDAPVPSGVAPLAPMNSNAGAESSSDIDRDLSSSDSGVGRASAAASNRMKMARRWTALVDGNPASVRGPLLEATVRSEFADNEVYEIISPQLATGTQRVELVLEQPILPTIPAGDSPRNSSLSVDRGEIKSLLAVPVPVADRIELPSPLKIMMPLGIVDSAGVFWRVLPDTEGSLGDYAETGGFQHSPGLSEEADSVTESTDASDWSFKIIPDFPIPIVLRSRLGEEKLTEIPRAFLRSLVGKQFRHEHLMATVRGGRRVRLGLPASLQTIQVDVLLDGRPTEYTRDASGLRIDLPDTSRSAHLLDVRIWVEEPNNPWWSRTEPMIRLPVGSGLQYWQLVVPTDSHLYWASNQSGRAMQWKRDGLNLSRVPTASDAALIRWALDLDWQFGDSTTPLSATNAANDSSSVVAANSPDGIASAGIPSAGVAETESDGIPDALLQAAMRESLSNATFAVPGNRYLFFAGNVFSFAAITVSRTVLWLAVGGLVLFLAAVAQWFPGLHQSLAAFVLAIGLAGLLVIAPDGIVLTAQLVMISFTLVAVFYAISAVAIPRGGQRALPPRSSKRDSVVSRPNSSRRERVVSTQAVAPTKAAPQRLPQTPHDQQETHEFDADTQPVLRDSDASLMPSTNPAARIIEDSDSDESSVKESAASRDSYHATDSRSDSDSSEAVR